VTINGKLIEIALFFDHDINDEDTQPIQAYLSVLFTKSMFGLMSHTHGLVLHRIGDEFGRYQRLGYFYILADNLSWL
jgi:hypothetical protein